MNHPRRWPHNLFYHYGVLFWVAVLALPALAPADDAPATQPAAAKAAKSTPAEPQPTGITFENIRKLQQQLVWDGYAGLVKFQSDFRKGVTNDGRTVLFSTSGWWGESVTNKPNKIKSVFQLKGTFTPLCKPLRGENPPMGHIDREVKNMPKTYISIGSSWDRDKKERHPLYPLGDTVKICHIECDPSGEPDASKIPEHRFVIASSNKTPKDILACRFIGPFSEADIPIIQDAMKWGAMKLSKMSAAELRAAMMDKNPVKGMLALEQLHDKGWGTPEDHIILLMNVPTPYAKRVYQDIFNRCSRFSDLQWSTPSLAPANTPLKKSDVEKASAILLEQFGRLSLKKQREFLKALNVPPFLKDSPHRGSPETVRRQLGDLLKKSEKAAAH